MNRVVLAVAGSRKTQSIVDACAQGDGDKRRLVLTYTTSAQNDVDARLDRACARAAEAPTVTGWYAFLLHHWVRPYLPLLYPGRRLTGLNFEGKAQGVDFSTGADRFLDPESRAYKRHLAKLAFDVAGASRQGVVDRLEHIFDEIYIDEVQDLTGWDLEILQMLLRSTIRMTLVGDVRQSLFNTNPQDPKHKQYRDLQMLDWFALQEKRGRLVVEHSNETWRCNAEVARFADTIFAGCGFPETISRQTGVSDHDGVFLVHENHVDDYIAHFAPLCLRQSKATRHPEHVDAVNFGVAKGVTRPRVLIFPTGPIRNFLAKSTPLEGKAACGLYVGVTRAVHSVAFVVNKPVAGYPVWTP